MKIKNIRIHNRPAYNSEVHATRDMGVGELNNCYEDAELADTIVAVGTNALETQTKFMATQWRGLEAPGKQQEKEKFPYLVNNGRANHVWQSIYLDQYNDFVMDRWPLPFLEMNPDDMKELSLNAGDLVEVYNDNGSTQAMATAADGKAKAELYALRLSDRDDGKRRLQRRQRTHHPELQADLGQYPENRRRARSHAWANVQIAGVYLGLTRVH
jgi:anaerobic selenocysteine-containing dehydrogenase